MTGKKSSEQAGLHRPNYKAYIFLGLFTAVAAGIYWAGARAISNLGHTTVLGELRSTYLVVEIVVCGLAWFYVTENLLRHYEADELGLTVYRLLLPPLRYSWDQIVEVRVYGYGDGFRLTVAGRGHLTVMLECLTRGQELAGYIQAKAACRKRRGL